MVTQTDSGRYVIPHDGRQVLERLLSLVSVMAPRTDVLGGITAAELARALQDAVAVPHQVTASGVKGPSGPFGTYRTDPELLKLLHGAATLHLSPEEIQAQRRSWVRSMTDLDDAQLDPILA